MHQSVIARRKGSSASHGETRGSREEACVIRWVAPAVHDVSNENELNSGQRGRRRNNERSGGESMKKASMSRPQPGWQRARPSGTDGGTATTTVSSSTPSAAARPRPQDGPRGAARPARQGGLGLSDAHASGELRTGAELYAFSEPFLEEDLLCDDDDDDNKVMRTKKDEETMGKGGRPASEASAWVKARKAVPSVPLAQLASPSDGPRSPSKAAHAGGQLRELSKEKLKEKVDRIRERVQNERSQGLSSPLSASSSSSSSSTSSAAVIHPQPVVQARRLSLIIESDEEDGGPRVAAKDEDKAPLQKSSTVVSLYMGDQIMDGGNGIYGYEDNENEAKAKAKEESTVRPQFSYPGEPSVVDIYSTVDEVGLNVNYSAYDRGEGQDTYYSKAVDEELTKDEEVTRSIYEDEVLRDSSQSSADSEQTSPENETHSDDEEAKQEEENDDDDVNSPLSTFSQGKNWNERFQVLLDQEHSAEKYEELAKLAHDFVFAAETYGKIIISELSLPVSQKTIKPIAVGGQAGGEKYIVQGIFFKFALDIYGIYGGDQYAMKAASHDLKGLINYYSCQIPGLHVPLMALIDYLGFRLIAITILPINTSTLKYGSSDAGVTVLAEDPALNRLMKKAGKKMHLQGHYVGLPGSRSQKLYAPVDIEGHLGTDGRYYVVDFARTFPPERPSPQNRTRKGVILYNLLRPELVKSNDVPLSSDAYTVWARADMHKEQYNSDVTEATRRLIKVVIPAVATKLNALLQQGPRPAEELIEIIHSAGVNVRHLGYLRRQVHPTHQQNILIEMIVRIVRKDIDKLLREKTRSSGIPSEEPHRVAVVQYLNRLIGRHKTSKYYWRDVKDALEDKFPKCLLDHEIPRKYDLRKGINPTLFLNRLERLPTVSISEQARQDLRKAIDNLEENWSIKPPDFKFLPCDLLPFPASVKHMNLIDIAEANAMFYTSLKEQGSDQARLLKLGLEKYQMAVRKMPFIDADILLTLGNMLIDHAREADNIEKSEELLDRATIAFQTAINIHPKHASCIVGLGDTLLASSRYYEAALRYREALAIEPNHARAHMQLGRAYYSLQEQQIEGEKFTLNLVEEEYRKALQCDPKLTEALIFLGDLLFEQISYRGDEETNSLLCKETAHLWESILMIDPNTQLTKIVNTVERMQKLIDRYNDTSGSLLAIVWDISNHSQIVRDYLCKLLSQISTWGLGLVNFNARILTELLNHCPALSQLTIHERRDLHGEMLANWITNHTTLLHIIDLDRCSEIDDTFLRKLAATRHAYILHLLAELSPHVLTDNFSRRSLQTLVLNEASRITKEALMKAFAFDESKSTENEKISEAAEQEEPRWGALTRLEVGGIPSVDHEVIAAICRSCQRLVEFNCLKSSAEDRSLACLPSHLQKVSLGGSLSVPAINEFVLRCQSITHFSIMGVDIPYHENFKLANILPQLTWFQTVRGSVFLFTGTEKAGVKFTSQANSFRLLNAHRTGIELYRVAPGAVHFMTGKDLRLLLRSQGPSSQEMFLLPSRRFIDDEGAALTRCSLGAPGNLIQCVTPGATNLSSLVTSTARRVESKPPIITCHHTLGSIFDHQFEVAPRQNLTMAIALYYQLIITK